MPSNWRGINSLRSSKYVLPQIETLKMEGVAICEKPTSVLIPLHLSTTDIVEMRDWIAFQGYTKFKIYNRFQFQEYIYRVDREIIGTNFRFADEKEAFYFKLFWH
jgi:hypothetical protein